MWGKKQYLTKKGTSGNRASPRGINKEQCMWRKEAKHLRFGVEPPVSWQDIAVELKPYFPKLTDRQAYEKN